MRRIRSRKKSHNKIMIKVSCDENEEKIILQEIKKAIRKGDHLLKNDLQYNIAIN